MKVEISNKMGLVVTIDNGLGDEQMNYDETTPTEAVEMCMKMLAAYGYSVKTICNAAMDYANEHGSDIY